MRVTWLLAISAAVSAAQQDVVRSFEEDGAGKPPDRLLLAVGRDAAPARWLVQPDADNHVLVHLAQPPPSQGFAVAVHEASYDGVELSARVRMQGGSRRAGLVWRYVDPQNHFAVQLDVAAQALSVYRVAAGNRIRIDRDDELELDPSAWHALRVVQDGDALRVYLGGIPVFRDRSRVFRGAGAAGLWAAGDATVAFDDLQIAPVSERRR
jgi:hypothetical protein